jgi:hypothetical protein
MRKLTKERLYFFYPNPKTAPAAVPLRRLPLGLTKGRWLLLLLCAAFMQAGAQTALTANPKVVYDNDVAAGAPGAARRLTITNTSAAAIVINTIALTGNESSQFELGALPQLPLTLNANDSFALTVAFAPDTVGLKTTQLTITAADDIHSFSVPLRGLGTAGVGGTSEPSLQALFNLFEINVNVGDNNPSTNVIHSDTSLRKAALLGEELAIQQFVKAGTGIVTIEPLAVFGPTQANPVVTLGWYTSGNRNSRQELLAVSNSPTSNAQTVQVPYTGSTAFDPGTAAFGFYSQWPFFQGRLLYSEDSLNNFTGSIPHHVRVYPYIKGGVQQAYAYVVAFEEHTLGFDYQDIIFVVRNVRPASEPQPAGPAALFIENRDRFPNNDRFVASRLQEPWKARTNTVAPFYYNSNHDTARVRIYNHGTAPLLVSGTELSPTNNWRYLKLGTAAFDPAVFPLVINSGKFLDLTLQFVHSDTVTTREIKQLIDTLTIVSNDGETPRKILQLRGLWQKLGEGSREPTAQQTITAFGFQTKVGFPSNGKDPDEGKASKPKGDEILSSYFVRADITKPVTIRQMSAYHGCCTQKESFRWYPKVSTRSQVKLTSVFSHIGNDAQSLLPRRNLATGAPAEGSFNPSGAFGFRIGSNDYSDTLFNPQRLIGIRVWKAKDFDGNIISDTYIVANDYLGTENTNFDYNDNMYYVSNIRPETGTAYYSLLVPTPSAVDFAEKRTGTETSFALRLKSSGQTYANGTADPDLTIRSVAITGENSTEFLAIKPSKDLLTPQDSTTINISFKPVSEGLKIADLLVYYNNSRSPLRVPLYGIAKDSGTTVNLHYRIKSGVDNAVTVNGNAWESDKAYAFDNLERFVNPQVKEITATDEDALYFVEQSSNKDKAPFRYVVPLDSGSYVVRLHFSEVYFGTPGRSFSGGAGSRVMGVTMENELKIANLDIVKEVGVAAALVRNVPVNVTDGKLDMNFTASVNRPSLSAVEVYSFTRTTPLPPPVDTTTPPPPTDTVVVPPPPPPPADTVVVTPPPPTDTVVVTPPPPVDTTTPPPTDTVIVTPPPPVDTVVVPPPPPPVDTVIVTPPPPVDTVVVPPPPVRLLVYPNPSTGRFSILFPLTRQQTVRLVISDVLGRRYGEEKFSADAGNNKKEVDITRLRLKPAVYLLELYYEEKSRDVIKIVIE